LQFDSTESIDRSKDENAQKLQNSLLIL